MSWAALLVSQLTIAAPWYVDGDAECPGAGTTQAPFCDLQAAVSNPQLAPGDEILIRDAAVPYAGATVTGVDGAADASIVMRPDAGHAPILIGEVSIDASSYWTIRGLTFDGAQSGSRAAVSVNVGTEVMRGLVVENNTIVGWGGSLATDPVNRGVISIRGVQDTPIEDPIVRNNVIVNGRGKGIYLNQTVGGLVSNNEIADMRCQLNADGPGIYGVHLAGSNAARVTGNRIHDFAGSPCHRELEIDDYVRIAGVLVQRTDAAEVDRNYLQRFGMGDATEGIGVNIMQGGQNALVHHNIVVDADQCGLGEGVAASGGGWGTRFISNTVIGGSEYGIDLTTARSTVVIDNVVMGAGEAQIRLFLQHPTTNEVYTWEINNNLYFSDNPAATAIIGYVGERSLASWQAGCGCDAASMFSDPLLAAGVDDFTPAQTSPAVDAGAVTPQTQPYNATAPDLGAVEAPLPIAATISAENPDRITLLLDHQGPGPLQVDSACEGFTIVVEGEPAPVTGCDVEGRDAAIVVRLAQPATVGQSVSLSYLGPQLRDSAQIGRRVDGVVQPFEIEVDNASTLNSVPGAGSSSTGGGTSDSGTAEEGGTGSEPVTMPNPQDTTGGAAAGSAYPDANGCTCRDGGPRPWSFALILLCLSATRRSRDCSPP